MLTIEITDSRGGIAKYKAATLEPFGAACVILTGAWSCDWTGTRHESDADARSIILPAPAASGERIEARGTPA